MAEIHSHSPRGNQAVAGRLAEKIARLIRWFNPQQERTSARTSWADVRNHMAATAVGDGARMGQLLPATVHGFAHFWNGLAKQGTTWDDNPWVWRVGFKRVEM